MTQQPIQPETLSNILYRLDATEKDISQIKSQLKELPQSYVLTRENDLRLQSVQETVKRIEADVGETKKQVTTLSTQMTEQKQEVQQRDAQQRESQDKLVIRVLWGALSIVITIISLAIVAYYTHILH